MFGFKYIRFDSMDYVIHYRKGKKAKEGRGLAFWYFAPNSSIVSLPTSSQDLPFIFTESTQDFQTVTIQGQLTYRVATPQQLADMLDFTVDAEKSYLTDDPDKLPQRLVNEAQTATSAYVQALDLKTSLRSLESIEDNIRQGLVDSQVVKMLGIEVLGVHVLAVRPTAEMARALEAETREALQQEADQAVFERRNFAVEKERMIRESELNTEIAVEEKQKQISEKRMETAVVKQENEQQIRTMAMEAQIGLEKQRRDYIELKSENEKTDADTRQYSLKAMLEPYKEMDWKKLMALHAQKLDAGSHIALAFRELAENAEKIDSINISPELLDSILRKQR